MKIAHVGPSAIPILFAHGGAVERRMIELAREQARKGHDVTVYSADTTAGERTVDGFHYRTIPARGTGWLRSLRFLRAAGHALRKHPVDLIHFHNVPEGIWFAPKANARFLSYDYFHSRRWQLPPARALYRQTLLRYDRLLPVSEFCLRGSKAFWNLPDDRVRVLHNGVNVAQFHPDPRSAAALRDALGLGRGPILLYVGRVCEQKGTPVLLRAFRELRGSRPDVQLVVAGPVERFGTTGGSTLVDDIRQCGGRYLGAVPESDLAATYNLATVFVMPTVRDEMFGMSAAEVQACGKPVVCSAQGGLTEVVPTTSGMHFPVGDSHALAERLKHLLANPALYQELSSAARTNSMRFSWPVIVTEALRLYDDVQAERHRARKRKSGRVALGFQR